MANVTTTRYSIFFVMLLTLVSIGRGQSDEHLLMQKQDMRAFSIYTGLGYAETFVVGGEYQLNDRFALGVKADIVNLGKGETSMGTGVGVKGSYFFSRTGEGTFLSVNVVNVEASYLFWIFEEGRLAEVMIGHDSIEGDGIGFLWSIGIDLKAPAGHPLAASLAAKIGANFNL